MIKDISELFKEKLKWNPIPESTRDFFSNSYPHKECYLRMNNFPEEPLWTLFYNGKNVDMEDTPKQWDVTYRSEL